jgi:hypothetical protein
MISTPTIQTNTIGGSSSISFTSVSSLNSFIQQAAVNNLTLIGLTIYSPSNFNQLSQPFTLNRLTLSGNASTKIVTPIVDPYQKTAVLKGVDMMGFILDGMSSIDYNILPNSQVQLILSVTERTGIDSTQSFKDQTNAVDTFDIIANSGEIPQQQISEPEELIPSPIKDQLLEINNKSSESLENNSLDELTAAIANVVSPKSKTSTSKASKSDKEAIPSNLKVFIPWIIAAVVIAYLLFDENEV